MALTKRQIGEELRFQADHGTFPPRELMRHAAAAIEDMQKRLDRWEPKLGTQSALGGGVTIEANSNRQR